MTTVQGGSALPVSVSTQAPQGGPAIPVAVVSGRPVAGGDATPVYVVSAAELAAGAFVLEGGDPRPVVAVADSRPTLGQRPMPVYVVSGSLYAPTDIAGLVEWLKADAITGLADGDAVASWADSSGNGNAAVQATVGVQPTYRLNAIGRLPAVRFDGVNDWLRAATPAAVGGITIFSVVHLPSAPVGTQYITDFNRPASYLAAMSLDTAVYNAQAWDTAFRTSTRPVQSGAHVWALRASAGGVVTAYSDGVAGTPAVVGAFASPSGSQAAIGSIRGGPSNFLSGDLGEFIVYSRALTDAEMAQVQNYLQAKWGTP